MTRLLLLLLLLLLQLLVRCVNPRTRHSSSSSSSSSNNNDNNSRVLHPPLGRKSACLEPVHVDRECGKLIVWVIFQSNMLPSHRNVDTQHSGAMTVSVHSVSKNQAVQRPHWSVKKKQSSESHSPRQILEIRCTSNDMRTHLQAPE